MKIYDVIIIGGSIAGLSSAMTLGRSLRKTLVVDSGNPCNRFTPQSHNFITQDGNSPFQITQTAREQISKYKTIEFYDGEALNVIRLKNGNFKVEISSENNFYYSKKLILATGLIDNLPVVKGLWECWGVSVIHCPYCHGYEFNNLKTGILANGEQAFHYAKLVINLTKKLTIFTNGIAEFLPEQLNYFHQKGIKIIETELDEIKHFNGFIKGVLLQDQKFVDLDALYVRPITQQSCSIPKEIGCKINENGLIEVDVQQKTTIPGVFACGDNSSLFRSVAFAASSGNMAGASINLELQN